MTPALASRPGASEQSPSNQVEKPLMEMARETEDCFASSRRDNHMILMENMNEYTDQ